MIEITYHTSDETGENVVVKPPKNIRQIGSPRGRHKIYVEDYVHTYLHSTLLFGEDQQRAAILLGRSEVSQEIRYTFIEGAINCEDFIFQKDGILFDESCWEYIYQEMKQYFDQQVIVGWFLGRPGFPLKISHTVEAAQRKYFSGRDKVLYLWDPQEGEDAFFAYEQGTFQKKEGYYVYYEKNLAMQEYMVCQRERTRKAQGGIQEMAENYPQTEEMIPSAKNEAEFAKEMSGEPEQSSEAENQAAGREQAAGRDQAAGREQAAGRGQAAGKNQAADKPQAKGEAARSAEDEAKWDMLRERVNAARTSRTADAAIGNYRSMLQKRQKKQAAASKNLFLYGAATVALIAVCISGVVNLNSYQKMKQMEEVLLMISKPLEEQQGAEQQDQRQISVQTVSGDVKPQEDSGENSLDSDENAGPEGDQQAAQQTGTDSQNAEGLGNDSGGEGQPAGSETGQTTENQQGGQSAEGQPGEGQSDGQTSAQGTEGEPAGSESSQSEGAASQEAMAQSYREQGYYVVQPGDRLEMICRQLYPGEDMMDKICELNQIEDVDKILVGQKLILP